MCVCVCVCVCVCALGEESVDKEMKSVFPAGSHALTPSTGESSHAAAVTRADKLLTQLRNPTSLSQKYVRRRYNRKIAHTSKRKEYQRNLVVIDYPGKIPPTTQVLHDYDKVYEGCFSFNNDSTEEEIKDEIAGLIQLKNSYINDFSSLSREDLVYVKCVNRRIRVPDGKPVYDGECLKNLFRSGNVYIRLTKSFSKHKVFIFIKCLHNMHACITYISHQTYIELI